MNIDDKLSQVFEVEPIGKVDIITNNVSVIAVKNEALDHDYETTRSNLHSILSQGQVALFHALEVAKQSEHPRAFEVVGGLMKNLSDINHQLLDLHKKKQSIESPKGETKEVANVTNNSVFVGSTTELSKMLDDIRRGK